jgi:Histidine kinase-, DNA gyrase B-, and HSP90-like ATPase
VKRNHRDLVADRHFILATRDVGYRSVSAAVAELVDNSLQAGATAVQIQVGEEQAEGTREINLACLDNGAGMAPPVLHAALQFGGSERFGNRNGLGRFGMGLPNSSVSQTRRIEVFSWRSGGHVWATHLDVDDVAEGRTRGIPSPVRKQLPEWAAGRAQSHGTLIVWSRCDRLIHRKAKTVASHLAADLGRIYRRALWGGVSLTINDRSVEALDPLFCHPDTGAGGAKNFGETLSYEVKLPFDEARSSLLQVRFTELPVEEWHDLPLEEKRARGIVAGAGVSVLRGKREIDYGWHCLGMKRRENYDDWWRCEVLFDPDLDELFGVTHSKQGVNPTPTLKSILGPDMESVARHLNARVRAAFERIREQSQKSLAVSVAGRCDSLLTPLPSSSTPLLAVDSRSAKYRLRKGISYRIVTAALDEPEFFSIRREDGVMVVVLNVNHPFYQRAYMPACADERSNARYTLEALLLSAARAEVETELRTQANTEDLIAQRRAWSDALALFLTPPLARAF